MYYYRLISSMLKAVISSLGTGLYAVYKATSIVTTLNTNIFRVYNGDNVNDTSGNAQNGTNVGSVTFTSGKIGNAFTFNGSNYISLPTDMFNTFTGDFSINMWVNIVNTGATQCLLSSLAYDGTNAWGFNITNFGGTSIAIYNGTSTFYTLSEISPNPYNTWYMVTITRKASTGTKIYKNGTLSTSNTSTVNPVYNATNMKPAIGASSYGPLFSNLVQYYAANGTKIDALTIWDKELTGSEVTALYNSSTGLEYPFSTAITIDSANDSLGTYNGTAQGGLTYTAGKSGNAFTFNGTTAYVSLPDNMFNSLTGDFSINMWVNVVNTGTLQTLLSCKAYDGANAWGFSLFNYGTSRFDITNGSTSVVTLQDPDGSHNTYYTWYMVTVVRKASTGTKIYYNGTLAASNTSTQNIVFNPTTNKCAIGAYVLTYPINTGIYYYAGNGTKMDEVNIWNKELTSTEVTELYNASTGKFYPY